jgi:hypothetical protein
VGLLQRIKAAANAEQVSEAEVEHFDQVRSTLKSLVPGEPLVGLKQCSSCLPQLCRPWL